MEGIFSRLIVRAFLIFESEVGDSPVSLVINSLEMDNLQSFR
jgi:hypothetical protein